MKSYESNARRIPVLVGIGTATRREEDFARALEPMDLMLEAVRAAGEDSGSTAALSGTEYIAVPRGRWNYRNPAGEIARAIGAGRATTVLASVGVLQQTLIGEACGCIARGEAHTVLVAGADAGYRLLRAQVAHVIPEERSQDDDPDVLLTPAEELRHPVELQAGLQMPVGLYAIMESALRARSGLSVSQHRDQLADLGARFGQVAVMNPRAWQRRAFKADEIRDASERNPMQAFPYTRAHCSNWNVDQAAALLLCSAARAAELKIPRSQWIFPVASTESNHMVPVTARADLVTCPGATRAGHAALGAGALRAEDLDLVDLYSCFPLAVQVYADAIGLPLSRELTVTGGMPFAGGPYNNYVLQATCRAAEVMRAGRGRNALISCVSGALTKQAYGLWSTDPGPRGFVHVDVTETVAGETRALEVLSHYSGEATIAGYTVLHGRDREPRAVALVDTAPGQRAVCTSTEGELISQMQREEFVNLKMRVQDNVLLA